MTTLTATDNSPNGSHLHGMNHRGYCCVGLDNPRSACNVGGAMRACGIFGVSFLAVAGQRFRRAPTDTMKAYRHTPVLSVDCLHAVIPFDCVPVAVELIPDARNIVGYTHPERAFYIFGAEDATLGKRVLSWCRDVIYIPSDRCLNLAACVNVVLYDRMSKKRRK